MTDIVLDPINSGYNLSKINDNFDKIESNINTTSIQSTGSNNVMDQDFDMNSNQILNLPKPVEPNDVVRLQDLPSDLDGAGNGGVVFSDLSKMISGTAFDGSTVDFNKVDLATVIVNNTESNEGKASYKIMDKAAYTADTGKAEPDGKIIGGIRVGSDHYVAGNTKVAKRIQEGPALDVYQFGYRGIGVINNGPTTIATPDISKDESDVLDSVFTYAERGAPQDIGASSGGTTEYIQKGKWDVVFPNRSICNISRPLPYFINRCDVYFNNTDVRPMGPFVVQSSFGYNNIISQLLINYEIFNTDEEIYEAYLAGTEANGVEIMEFGHPDIAFPLESFTIYEQCVVTGGWQGFKGAREGILFGIEFRGCKAVNPLSWGMNLGANDQITTTCTVDKPFVRLTKRDTVHHNGYVWRALQHMSASAPIEPPAVPVSSEYWQIGLDGTGAPEVVGSQDPWATATFYRAFGKHYRFINMSNLTLVNPSGDGGTDQSPIFEFSGINLDIDHYHLEKHQKVFSDRNSFSIISGALTMGTLYLAECVIANEGNSVVQSGGEVFSCRVAHTSTADTEPLTGANWFDYWDKTSVAAGAEPAWAITTDYTTGDGTFLKTVNPGGRGMTLDNLEQKNTNIKRGRVVAIDGENVSQGRVVVGKGISRSLMKNMGGHQSVRGIVKPLSNQKQLLSLVSNFTYRPRSEENGTLFKTSLAPTGTLTVEIDGTAPTGTIWGFSVTETTGGVSNPAGTVSLTGINGAFFVGPTSVSTGTIWVEKLGTAVGGTANSWRTWTEAEILSTSEWVEYIPLGTYTTGTYTLPDSKTWADIAQVRVNSNQSIYSMSHLIDFEQGAVLPGAANNAIRVQSLSTSTSWVQLSFTGNGVDASITNSVDTITSVFVKYK